MIWSTSGTSPATIYGPSREIVTRGGDLEFVMRYPRAVVTTYCPLARRARSTHAAASPRSRQASADARARTLLTSAALTRPVPRPAAGIFIGECGIMLKDGCPQEDAQLWQR